MTQGSGSEPWPDDPRTTSGEDELDRARFARMVARRVDSLPAGTASVVFGLVGAWGSGKTSVVNMILEELPQSWAGVSFAPWVASGSGGLVLEFLRTIDAALGGRDSRATAARSAVREYGAWGASLLGIVPGVGSGLQALATKGLDRLIDQGPWSFKFSKVSKELRRLGGRVLVVCDDIDRLDAAELLEFLKVVRLLGRFPNIHYLVVYDQATVEDLLHSQGVAGRQSNFMEKIVQYPYEIPPISDAKKLEIAAATIDGLLASSGARLASGDEARATELMGIIARSMSTPRAQFRYRHQLESYSAMLEGEIDPLDFAAITLMRVNFHPVFEALPSWAPGFRVVGKVGEDGDPIVLDVGSLEAKIGGLCGEARVPVALELIDFLFPRITKGPLNTSHDKALASEEYFNRYFYFGVPPDDVSDRLVAEGLDAVLNQTEAESTMGAEFVASLDSLNPARARLAYSKAYQARRDADTGSAEMVTFLSERLELRRTESDGFESPVGALMPWLIDEVVRAYRTGLIGKAQLLALFGETTILTILLSAGRSQGARVDPASTTGRLLSDFAGPLRESLEASDLRRSGNLVAQLRLIELIFGTEALVGYFDQRVLNQASDITLIASEMVEVTRRRIGSGRESLELSFTEDLWQTIITAPVRDSCFTMLPTLTWLTIDTSDTAPENRANFGVHSARAFEERRSASHAPHEARVIPVLPSPPDTLITQSIDVPMPEGLPGASSWPGDVDEPKLSRRELRATSRSIQEPPNSPH